MVRYTQQEETALLMIATISDIKTNSTRRRNNRKFYIAPEHLNRTTAGAFATVVPNLRDIDVPRHYQYFRMTAVNVDELFNMISTDISRMKRHRMPIPPQIKLMIALQ